MNECRSKRLRNTSTESQCARLLERLQEAPIDTFTARDELNVAHPAGRVQDLRDSGYKIITHLGPVTDSKGVMRKHSATYYLSVGAA